MEIHPATPERWDDLCRMLVPGRSRDGCWCLAYRLPAGEFGRAGGAEREARMRALVGAEPAPGLLGYLAGEVVGWCNVGPRSAMGRLTRSRTIPAVDDLPVWSVVCFVVRAGHRRQGVAEELLHAAVEYARGHGAPAVEGYPIDPRGDRVNPSLAYVGTTGMFARAGFRRLARTTATSAGRPRWVMRLDLTAS